MKIQNSIFRMAHLKVLILGLSAPALFAQSRYDESRPAQREAQGPAAMVIRVHNETKKSEIFALQAKDLKDPKAAANKLAKLKPSATLKAGQSRYDSSVGQGTWYLSWNTSRGYGSYYYPSSFSYQPYCGYDYGYNYAPTYPSTYVCTPVNYAPYVSYPYYSMGSYSYYYFYSTSYYGY